ncbi:MAG: hypothetical protein JSV99_06940 [Planctomycetota bacterium]|nr:MAG: hypothetical protein JSV99_06940 [Planctomycetota bacterium]
MFAARGCDEPGGLSDSGQTFTVRVTVTGGDYGSTSQAEAEFGIALLGDINNDGRVNWEDFGLFAGWWRESGCGECGGADDLARFSESWLAGI